MALRVGFLCLSHPHCGGRLGAAASLSDVEIAGVYDPDEQLAQRTAATYATAAFASGEDLLSDESIRMVVIDGRNSQNSAWAIRAAEAGKAILLEKPGAENLERAKEVSAAVLANGVVCQVGYHLRFSPSIRKGLEILSSGVLGRITTVRFHAAVMQPWLTNEWFCDTDDRGGMVYLDFCHMLDLLTHFLGPPTGHLSKIVRLDGATNHPFEDSAAFVIQFGDVLAAGECCGWEANDWISTWDMEFYGTEGTLKLGIHPPWWKLYRPGHGWQEEAEAGFDGELNYRLEVESLANCLVRGDDGQGCDIHGAVNVIETIEKMYRENRL